MKGSQQLLFLVLISMISVSFTQNAVEYPNKLEYISEGLNLFEQYLIDSNNIDVQNLQFSICSKSQRDSCNTYARNFLQKCKDNWSESCWREATLIYPKCLKCYCPLISAKVCQATSFIQWLVYQKTVAHGDCWNLLQSQCIPILLASYLQYETCYWCMCLADKKGYNSFYKCSESHKQFSMLSQLGKKLSKIN